MIGLGTSTKRERTHVYVNSIAERNAYPPALRDWGMVITVINYPAAGDQTDYKLTYSAGASLSDNTKWLLDTGGGGGSTVPVTESFVGDGVTTDFVLSSADPVIINGVYANGQRLTEGTHYTKNDATKTVTTTDAVVVGVALDIEYFTGLSVTNISGLTRSMGDYDASSNLFPETGGSGVGGAVENGNIFRVTVPGDLIIDGAPETVPVNTLLWAMDDNPGQDDTKWRVL